jgi:hypothetical protein
MVQRAQRRAWLRVLLLVLLGLVQLACCWRTDTKMAPREWAHSAGRAGAGCWADVGGGAGLEPLVGNVSGDHGTSAGVGCYRTMQGGPRLPEFGELAAIVAVAAMPARCV